MKYKIEKCSIVTEWEEVKLSAADFFKLFNYSFRKDGIHEHGLDSADYDARFKFSKRSIGSEGTWGVDDNRAWISSYYDGDINWSDKQKQYIEYTDGRKEKLGALVSVTFRLDEYLKKALDEVA